MLREIVKIANKLDSLGLTKEADILDAYLSKSAGRFDGFIVQPPPPGIADLFKKWLTTSHIGNATYENGIGSFIPTSGRSDKTSAAMGGIRSISMYTQKELARDNGNDLYMWYVDNIQDAGVFSGNPDKFLAVAFNDLAQSIRDVVPELKQNTPDVADNYLAVADELERTSQMWIQSRVNKSSSPSKPAPSPEGPPVAAVSPSVTPKPVPTSPSSTSSDPWAIYGSDARKLKATWLARTTATKKNPSFENFQAWLRARSVGRMDVNGIMDRLIAETSAAGMPSAASRSSSPVEAVSSSPSSVSSMENMDWKSKMMGRF